MASSLLDFVFAPPSSRDDGDAFRVSGDRRHDVATATQKDVRLITRIAQDDIAAFDTIVLAYDRPLRQFARRMVNDADTADDIVQDVFVWLWEHRHTLAIQGTLRAYLYGAARNRALSVLRRTRTEETCMVHIDSSLAVPGMGTPTQNTDAATERAELANALSRAFDTLPPRTRQAALLRWRDRMSRAEIAEIMNVAVPTVNNQLTQAARVVRALLIDYLR